MAEIRRIASMKSQDCVLSTLRRIARAAGGFSYAIFSSASNYIQKAENADEFVDEKLNLVRVRSSLSETWR